MDAGTAHARPIVSEASIPHDRTASLFSHRRFLDECRFAGSRERDKTILTIAGGSLAVSVAFLERVVPVIDTTLALMLFVGWALEIAAMTMVLRSHHTSEAALHAEVHRVDTMIACGSGDDLGWPNPPAAKTERLNVWASTATVLGLIVMLSHAALSLYAYGEKNMSTSKPVVVTDINKPSGTTAGYVPPPPPPSKPDTGKK